MIKAGRKLGAEFPNGYKEREVKRGVKRGTRMPAQYSGGDPYINLCLAILKQAKLDEGTKYNAYGEECKKRCWDEMWAEFQKTELSKMGLNVIPLDVAWWVLRREVKHLKKGGDYEKA